MRLAYMDSARALLMLLGIPYHAALVFHIQAWRVQDNSTSYTLSYLAEFIHLFRMPAFFIIAGFFSLMTLRKLGAPLPWLYKRAVRIGVPLICGAIVILPLQALIATWPNPFQGAGFSHLWFLLALVLYSAILVATDRLWDRLSTWRFTPLLVIVLTSLLHIVIITFEERNGPLPYYLGTVLRNLPYFFVGVLFRANLPAWESFVQLRWPVLAVAVAIAAAFPLLKLFDAVHIPAILAIILEDIAVWLATYSALAMFKRFLDRPSDLVNALVPAAFTIYLFHHPIIIGLGRLTQNLSGPPVLEWLALCILAGLLSYAIHLLISRSRIASFLFNGELPRAPVAA